MSQPTTVPLPGPGKPKLLDQVRQRCRVRHLALKTEQAYVGWIRKYILYHHKRHPLEMGAAEVTAFLTHLAVDRHVAASTQNQALSALPTKMNRRTIMICAVSITWPTKLICWPTMTWPTKLTKSSGSTCTARITPS